MKDLSLFIHDNLYKKYLHEGTLTGSQNKIEVSLNGRKGIFKDPQFEGSFDCFIEEFCYHLANQLHVPHCYQKQIIRHGSIGVFSQYEVKDIKQLISLEEVLGTSDPESAEFIGSKLGRGAAYIQYTKAVLFDVLTRQIDRNTNNMAFNLQPFTLYPLFDSGLSMFSTFEDKSIANVLNRSLFRMRYAFSNDYLASLHKGLALTLVKQFEIDFASVVNKCYIPSNVTQYRLDCMEQWLSMMLKHMKEVLSS